MNTIGCFGYPDVSDAVRAVESRLPPHVARALEHVTVSVSKEARAVADAGHNDIRIRFSRIRGDSAALMGIVAHEAAHVYAGHYAALLSNTKSAAVCEIEADNLARQWGFGYELERRALWFGR